MPFAAKRPCRQPGCPALVDSGYCDKHRRADRRRVDQERGSAASRGYGAKWRKARQAYLVENPLCRACRDAGRVTAATVVDHIEPHRGDQRLFWRRSNWQPLCASCHARKTAAEDGGFGNPGA